MKSEKGEIPMVEIILSTLVVLAIAAVLPFLWVLFLAKKGKMLPKQGMSALTQGPRYRDGCVTYSQYRGVRYNIVPENPYQPHKD